MKRFLLDIVEQLCCKKVEGNVMVNGKRMLSAIVIICCLHDMTPKCISMESIPPQHLCLLLSLLCLMPDVKHQKCEDWDYLIALIPKSFRKTAYESVLALTIHLSHIKYFDLPDWLFAVPVVHFLKPNACKPFHEVEYNPRRIPWGDKLIGLQTIRSETSNSTVQ